MGRRGDSPKKRRRAVDNTGGITCDANTARRARLNFKESAQPIKSPVSTLATLSSLCSVDTVSTSLPVHPHEPSTWPTPGARQDVTERRRVAALRQRFSKAQRPSDPALYCCDYNAAEQANAAGHEGPRKYGGAQLCMECLGAEYSTKASTHSSIKGQLIRTAGLSWLALDN